MGQARGRGRMAVMAIGVVIGLLGAPRSSFAAPPQVTFDGQVLDAAAIHDEQIAVVNHNDGIPIQAAQRLLNQIDGKITGDHQSIAADNAASNEAGQAHQAAEARLQTDTLSLVQARDGLAAADSRVEGDRSRIRALAVGTYTGQLTNPQPSGSPTPEADQQAAIDVAEIRVVAGIVQGRLRQDIVSMRSATLLRDRLVQAVTGEQSDLAASAAQQAAATTRLHQDEAALSSDVAALPAANAQLSRAQAALTADLASVAAPAGSPPGSLSLLGGSALNPAQMAAWYHAEGYSDLTSAPIEQLAAWYVQAGNQLGIRGDVAFAQSILETGGFSSPDAVDLNNYAGIGHCDSCASGWQFPSPNGGVVGHVQLLRIFATSAAPPAGAPGPVMPSLTVSGQHEAGCCPSVESLTGIWATDPSYGTQILAIYQRMLGYVLSQR